MKQKYNNVEYIGKKYGKLTVKGIVSDRGIQFITTCDCGNPFKGSASKIVNGRCLSCGCNKVNNRTKYMDNKYIGKVYGQLTVVESYRDIGSETGVKFKCRCSCGAECSFPAKELDRGRITTCGEIACQIVQRDKAIYNSDKYIGNIYEYLIVEHIVRKGAHIYWKCTCTLCGKQKYFIASAVVKGNNSSCGCINSIGETKIRDMLDKHSIEYKREYSFEDLKSNKNRLLRFDFAIIKNNKLQCLIEYDGRQHLNASSMWSSGGKETREKAFNELKIRDNLKTEYCRNNEITLVRVTFKELSNIENILRYNNVI